MNYEFTFKRHSKPNISDVEFQEKPQNAYNGPNINDTQSGDNSRGFHNNYDVVAEPVDNGHPSGDNIAASYKLIEGKNDDMVYTDTLEGEYDTFNNRDKRKIKMQNENNHLYSHTNVEGNDKSDYDTMQTVVENDTDT
ncbi:hypothetical protein KUTeg_023112 [Tegillarca granosa]|uniref:Uncharacterized protein n=1 Tax=Tegillarca granosa TaxID=220873 RepID=A0ABQ9E681_TEGGR|nr:hypothetical protein KUTeg_023112 [Tegillarca granosa]